MNEPLVTVKFAAIERVTDSMIRVRTTKGTSITIEKPHDASLKMDKHTPGEGLITCPKALLTPGV